MMFALRSPVPASLRDSKHPARWVKKEAPLVVDVGANIGWFTLKAAEAGARVAAFEGAGHRM
jgi:2-polyprenyl-3-methyl-5-hydroxy-6-metoxy-1,4-benzoquinol methylase